MSVLLMIKCMFDPQNFCRDSKSVLEEPSPLPSAMALLARRELSPGDDPGETLAVLTAAVADLELEGHYDAKILLKWVDKSARATFGPKTPFEDVPTLTIKYHRPAGMPGSHRPGDLRKIVRPA